LADRQPDAAAFHHDRLRADEAPDATALVRRAEIAVQIRRLDDADRDYSRWLDGGGLDDRGTYLSYARLFLIRGDRNGFQRYFPRVLDAAADRFDASTAWQLGRIAGLSPCAADDAVRIVDAARAAVADPGAHADWWFALALAHYRAGQWESARSAA